MKKGVIYRLMSLLIVLAVIFTQVGVNLLHNHRGIPPSHPSSLESASDNSIANCNACAIDGMPVLYAEEGTTFDFTNYFSVPAAFPAAGEVITLTGQNVGRAPPIC